MSTTKLRHEDLVAAAERVKESIDDLLKFLRSTRLETEGEMYSRMLGKAPAPSEPEKAECNPNSHVWRWGECLTCQPAQPEPAAPSKMPEAIGAAIEAITDAYDETDEGHRCAVDLREWWRWQPVAEEDSGWMECPNCEVSLALVNGALISSRPVQSISAVEMPEAVRNGLDRLRFDAQGCFNAGSFRLAATIRAEADALESWWRTHAQPVANVPPIPLPEPKP